MELNDVGTSALAGSNGLDSHDLNGVRTSSVLGAHLSVALSNSALGGQVSVLSVHVVSATARVVTQPDGKVLDFDWLSLEYLFTN